MSATNTARNPVTIAPTTGMNAPRNTNAAIGMTSGMPPKNSPTMKAPRPMPTASTNATKICTRMKLVRVIHPATPAPSTAARAFFGNSRTVQRQTFLPSMSRKIVVNRMMNSASNACVAPDPALATPDRIDAELSCSHFVPSFEPAVDVATG